MRASLCTFFFVLPGDHPEDFGHSQSPLDVLLRSASQQQPVQGAGALAPPGYGRVSRQGEIRAGETKRRVEVRERGKDFRINLVSPIPMFISDLFGRLTDPNDTHFPTAYHKCDTTQHGTFE